MNIEEFSDNYNRFLMKCKSFDSCEAWDSDEYSEMKLFYENSMTNLILSLVASDEMIYADEVGFLNRFGIGNYTAESLQGIYQCNRKLIDKYFDKYIVRDIELLRNVNSSLCDEYTDLVKAACKLVIESDGAVAAEEKGKADKLLKKLS